MGDMAGMYVIGAIISSTILRHVRISLPKVMPSLTEYLMKESRVSSTIRVSSSDPPSLNTMAACRFGLIQAMP